MWPDGIVVSAPGLDDDPGFFQGVEDLAVQKFVAESGIEALDEAVLPRATGCDVCGSGSDRCNPVLNGFGHELGAVVRPYVLGHAPQDEQVRPDIDHVDGLELAVNPDRQAFMGKLVDDVEDAKLLSLMGSVFDKIVGPNMVRVFCPKTDTGPVGEPKPASLWLLLWDFQPLAPPQPLDPLVVHEPARPAQ